MNGFSLQFTQVPFGDPYVDSFIFTQRCMRILPESFFISVSAPLRQSYAAASGELLNLN
jgi:hypothetical protein